MNWENGLERIVKRSSPEVLMGLARSVAIALALYSPIHTSYNNVKAETVNNVVVQTESTPKQKSETKNDNFNYSSVPQAKFGNIKYVDSRSKGTFLQSMNRLRKYSSLEPLIDKYCKEFNVKEEDVIPFLIIESCMNPSAPTTSGGCTGIGQVSRAAVKAVNRSYKKNFIYTNSPKRIDDQVGAAVGYFSLKINELRTKYEIPEEDLASVAYFGYNAGGAPVDVAIKSLVKEGKALSWENIEKKVTPATLKSSARLYRGWSERKLVNKCNIIKSYANKGRTYKNYLIQLRG